LIKKNEKTIKINENSTNKNENSVKQLKNNENALKNNENTVKENAIKSNETLLKKIDLLKNNEHSIKKIENSIKNNETPKTSIKTLNSSIKPNENLENSNKTPNQTTHRLKKSEKMASIIAFSNENKPIEKKSSNKVSELNNFLNNIKDLNDFDTESPTINKNLLHDKCKSTGLLHLEYAEKQKKKNHRLFSISILEKVEELSKMDQFMQKE